MEEIYNWGLSIITGIQQIKSPIITLLMEGISFFGDPVFYFFLLMIIYWCVDAKKGFQLGTIIIFSGAFNTAIKQTLKVPRPYQRNPAVFIVEETGFSTPSGHSQGSASFYPIVANFFCKGKSLAKIIIQLLVAIFVPLLIGFSRIYLGVHYPTDVFLGLIIGFLTATGVLLFWDFFAERIASLRLSIKFLLLALLCLLLNHFSQGNISLSGLLFGFVGGHLFFIEKKSFDAKTGLLWQKILRILLGSFIVAFFYFIPKFIISFLGLDSPENQWYDLIRFLRYMLTGAVTSFLVPTMFLKLKLADKFPTENNLKEINQ
ncbi:MAG: phosphatase PAP2 family protein [Spirochaetaceae bacterium]|nr:phosphatase PAP2 family protein [Spirochaetaceae bacterium]